MKEQDGALCALHPVDDELSPQTTAPSHRAATSALYGVYVQPISSVPLQPLPSATKTHGRDELLEIPLQFAITSGTAAT